ncbi:MAG: cytochrome c-type biogenesis protein CcmH [Gemmatimonadota bacterium]|nr:MAG: cytochrome c-type biogenesis protein CcmH [Gemmatimonadota bacterium]
MKSATKAGMSLAIAIVLLLVAGAAAQTPQEQVDRQASRLFDQVMSPYCPGRTLTNCPSPQAEVLRDGITERLRAGATPDEIWEDLYEVYGDQVRSIPRATGFNLLAWIIPGLFFALGALLLIRWLRPRWSGVEPATKAPAEPLDPELDERLQSELSELESVV